MGGLAMGSVRFGGRELGIWGQGLWLLCFDTVGLLCLGGEET